MNPYTLTFYNQVLEDKYKFKESLRFSNIFIKLYATFILFFIILLIIGAVRKEGFETYLLFFVFICLICLVIGIGMFYKRGYFFDYIHTVIFTIVYSLGINVLV